jgi:hypothetical protein
MQHDIAAQLTGLPGKVEDRHAQTGNLPPTVGVRRALV